MQLLSQVPMLPKLQSKIKTQQSYIRRTSNLTQDFGAVNSKSQLSQQICVSMGQLRELATRIIQSHSETKSTGQRILKKREIMFSTFRRFQEICLNKLETNHFQRVRVENKLINVKYNHRSALYLC
ncbi:Hypothetical_protein [Hexamita inflata]|uniref:Hypothetical_protein n=1 Tax=Hexamita inflata TaxID=28002 RepID=A0AA86P7S9_9EUKA|nr:Hypothetical protein HINF_LOCUS21051 [Hexamita inflata]